jgi:SAM-dependent methyltransferase
LAREKRALRVRPLYEEPAYYGMMFDDRVDDVGFYCALVRGSRSVLEYGVGAGRVAIPMARTGCEVFGVDLSTAMLDALAARVRREPVDVARRLGWRHGDAAGMTLGRTFERVVYPFNGLANHESDADLAAVLTRVGEHLAPDGLFAFDVWLPNPNLLSGASTRSPWFDDPRTGERVCCEESFQYDSLTQVLTVRVTVKTFRGARPPETMETRLRQFFPEETLALLHRHGFDVVWRTTRYAQPDGGNWDGATREVPDERGEMLAYICRAAAPRTG